ncbi:MAG TPA: hypothetical protein VLH56_19475 [Dissulfurispiraceae bacterium]|nr:hypothetical protein [Dissulfurispiraceae bacterium]
MTNPFHPSLETEAIIAQRQYEAEHPIPNKREAASLVRKLERCTYGIVKVEQWGHGDYVREFPILLAGTCGCSYSLSWQYIREIINGQHTIGSVVDTILGPCAKGLGNV